MNTKNCSGLSLDGENSGKLGFQSYLWSFPHKSNSELSVSQSLHSSLAFGSHKTKFKFVQILFVAHWCYKILNHQTEVAVHSGRQKDTTKMKVITLEVCKIQASSLRQWLCVLSYLVNLKNRKNVKLHCQDHFLRNNRGFFHGFLTEVCLHWSSSREGGDQFPGFFLQ